MLLKEHLTLESRGAIKMEKLMDGKRVDSLGAFPYGAVLTLRARIPRRFGFAAAVLRVAPDGGDPRDLPFVFLLHRLYLSYFPSKPSSTTQ